ncbi:secreted protein [Penicillium chermesinum]|uniref:Secreted protein n=1 Tax=Penicillium chermesinum TaxID=63820 RepID=A0A9W9NNQ4_9EURO|nr:uncharacterized protein N7468_007802 [Penicillium chermesinum]KAJ5223260.1 secreted protein [Penicillium chermesinum]KAJ6155903.1 secreted protein [Penicillium chermesinum]
MHQTWFTAACLGLLAIQPVLAAPTPPNIPSASTAKSELGSLTVADQGSSDGYSRDKFKHWIAQGHECDTRDLVLKRDGTGTQEGADCKITGTWVSPYDGAKWTDASDLQIDHLVPLSNAWKSGASSWTAAERQDFANDLNNPQLLPVTSSVNESKGDRGPEEWKPPLESFYCTYAEMWVKVKTTYKLTITADEKSALSEMLDSC